MNSDREYHLSLWKVRRRIEMIERVKPPTNTSVFTLLIRPDDHVVKIRQMINEEFSKSSNIKSNQNRLSVQDGLRSISEHLKAYRFIPHNGLVCYYASEVFDPTEDKDTRIKIFFEPPRAINRFVYNCGPTFETGTLKTLLQDETAIGYIVIDGKGALFATVRGNSKQIHLKTSVDLPRKHTKGGQSASRFSRIREDARKCYISQICEKATEVFITENTPNVSFIVLTGQAQLKDHLERSSHFDQRLKPIIKLTLTVDYGGEAGLNDAIKLSTETVGNLRLGQEIKIISKFMDYLNQNDSSMVAYGIENVMEALTEGAVDTLIAWQDLSLMRWQVKDKEDKPTVLYLHQGETPTDTSTNEKEPEALIDWLAEKSSSYGSKLEIVSDESVEGNMLVQGFNGLVALLRYARMGQDED